LVPDDYDNNKIQFDSVYLPEAWHYMKDKWQRPSETWPYVIVIDDGFFKSPDIPVRPADSKGFPSGTAEGAPPIPGRVRDYGYHGTLVISLLGADANNKLNIAGVCGTWIDQRERKWGALPIPIRIGEGSRLPPNSSMLADAIEEWLPHAHTRVISISKNLVDQPYDEKLKKTLDKAKSRGVVVVTGAGNDKKVLDDLGWLGNYDNIIVVGGLNQSGTDYWTEPSQGTRKGKAVNIYAPAEKLTGIESETTTRVDSGTSYATPIVSGVVAMMLNANPTLWPSDVRQILKDTADLVAVSDGSQIPRLNAYAAVEKAKNYRPATTIP
jgi:subtilisin family serine protease